MWRRLCGDAIQSFMHLHNAYLSALSWYARSKMFDNPTGEVRFLKETRQ